MKRKLLILMIVLLFAVTGASAQMVVSGGIAVGDNDAHGNCVGITLGSLLLDYTYTSNMVEFHNNRNFFHEEYHIECGVLSIGLLQEILSSRVLDFSTEMLVSRIEYGGEFDIDSTYRFGIGCSAIVKPLSWLGVKGEAVYYLSGTLLLKAGAAIILGGR